MSSPASSPAAKISGDRHAVEQVVPQDIQQYHNNLNKRLKKSGKKQMKEHESALKFKRWGMVLITLGATLIVAAVMYGYSILGVFSACLSVLAIGLFAFSFDHQTEERRLNDDIKRLRFECDLLQLRPNRVECRAEKMLGNNDSQLRSYYELNIAQCSKIFWVGILCLVAGVGVIAATLHAVQVSQDGGVQAKIIIGVVGAVGSVLTNFVAAIFLRMHSEILTILKEFQSKLVDTQELYLANVLVSRINQRETKERALEALSIAMVRCGKMSKNNDAPTSQEFQKK